ncbi:hypothetical protein HAX54_030386 [Datura stramonium]|uniref:Uncharacterized protein n=1 Tax=Datura stramonium TaxID=4076 RepID=A0ABS8V9Q4_DATST|nr:hypothetical protein [Datura stramonium]
MNLNEPPTPTIQEEPSIEKEKDDGTLIGASEVVQVGKKSSGDLEHTATSTGEKESPTQLSSPKWDKTPMLFVTTTTTSPTLEDDEVPLNLVFNTKPHFSYRPSSKS